MKAKLLTLVLAAGLGVVGLTGCTPPVQAVPVATGLDFPASFTIDPSNNAIWYAERFSGEIRRRNLTTGQDVLVYAVPNVQNQGHQGLLGLALHPNYPTTRELFAFATRDSGNGDRNQVLRIPLDANGIGTSYHVIVNDTVEGEINVGGRILFGPDNKLWVHFGDHSEPSQAQNSATLSGKVLRLNPDGTVPADNPFPGSKVWAYGIRNSFGFDFDPSNGALWLVDNGPECNDEVGRIVKGGNHGWGGTGYCGPPGAPTNTNQDGPTPRILPEHLYVSPSIGPTAAAFCQGCGLDSGTEGTLMVGTANDGLIRRLTLNSARNDVVADEVLLDHTSSVLSIETRPGQPLYFSTPTGIYRVALQS